MSYLKKYFGRVGRVDGKNLLLVGTVPSTWLESPVRIYTVTQSQGVSVGTIVRLDRVVSSLVSSKDVSQHLLSTFYHM